MTDEEINEMTWLKLQYGPSNIQEGKIVLESMSGFFIKSVPVFWYKRPSGWWCCDARRVEYNDRRLTYMIRYYRGTRVFDVRTEGLGDIYGFGTTRVVHVPYQRLLDGWGAVIR